MLLTNVHIKRFRGLADLTIPLGRNTVIIGENNSGKSSLIDAIRLGLNRSPEGESAFHEFDYYMGEDEPYPHKSEGIEIEYEFTESFQGELDVIAESLTMISEIIIQIPSEEDNEVSINKVIVKVISKYDESRKDYSVNLSFLNAAKQPLGTTELHRMEFHQIANIFYLSALRNVGEYLHSSSPYWIKFLRARELTADEARYAQEQLSELNAVLIGQGEPLTVLQQLDQHLKEIQSIVAAGQQAEVSLRALPFHTWEVLERGNIYLRGDRDTVHLPIDRHGQGTQSMSVVLLFQSFSLFLLRTIGSYAEPILALEEPEAHLHPQAIRSLADQLKRVTSQKIITTHSPYLVQNMDLADLRLLRRKGAQTTLHYLNFKKIRLEIPQTEGVTRFFQTHALHDPDFVYDPARRVLTLGRSLTDYERRNLLGGTSQYPFKQAEIEQVFLDSQHLIGLREKSQLVSFLQKTRGDILFARAWLLVEGPSDYFYLQHFFTKVTGTSLDAYGISLIDYQQGGAPAVFVRVARQLCIPWMMICDGDEGGVKQAAIASTAGAEPYSHLGAGQDTRISVLPQHQSLEVYLMHNGFRDEYERVLRRPIDERETGETDQKYYKRLEDSVEKNRMFGGKIGAAIEICASLENQGDYVLPQDLQHFIERCVQLIE